MRALPLWLALAGCAGGTVQIADETATDTDEDTDSDPTTPDVLPSCDPFAVSVVEHITIDHGSTVAALPGGEQREITSLSIDAAEACGIDLRSGTLLADLAVGPDGYPDVVLCPGREGAYEGDQRILEEPVAPWSLLPPSDLPDNGGDKILEWSDTATFTVDRVFDDLRVRTRGELVIDGDVDILVNGTLELNNGIVSLTPGSELDLWVAGGAQILWASRLNAGSDSADVRLHVLPGASLEVNQGSTVNARVRAPDSPVVISGRRTVLVGTAQARELDVLWGAVVFGDEGLVCP